MRKEDDPSSVSGTHRTADPEQDVSLGSRRYDRPTDARYGSKAKELARTPGLSSLCLLAPSLWKPVSKNDGACRKKRGLSFFFFPIQVRRGLCEVGGFGNIQAGFNLQ